MNKALRLLASENLKPPYSVEKFEDIINQVIDIFLTPYFPWKAIPFSILWQYTLLFLTFSIMGITVIQWIYGYIAGVYPLPWSKQFNKISDRFRHRQAISRLQKERGKLSIHAEGKLVCHKLPPLQKPQVIHYLLPVHDVL